MYSIFCENIYTVNINNFVKTVYFGGKNKVTRFNIILKLFRAQSELACLV